MQSSESLSSPSKSEQLEPVGIRLTVWLLRIIVGGVFIVAGWSKCVDIWGSVIKIHEYLAAWQWDVNESLIYVGASLMSGAEMVLGVLLLCGCYRRVSVWLMLVMMAYFLPLSLYIWIENPVSDCGCFGEFLILSNRDTFLKNVALVVMLLFLLIYNRRVKGIFVTYTQWIVGGLASLYALVITGLGIYSQPLVDFRRFAPGMSILGNESATEIAYSFVYTKDGEEREFTVESLPDSTWNFVDRRLLSGSESVDDGFPLYDGDEEISADIFDAERVMLITVPDGADALPSATMIDDVASRAEGCGITPYLVLGGGEDKVRAYVSDMMPPYEVLHAESVQLKELARGEIALTMVENGRVEWKRTLASLSRDFLLNSSDCDFKALAPWGPSMMWLITLGFVGLTVVLCLIDRSWLMIFLLRQRRRMTKHLTIHHKHHKAHKDAAENIEKTDK